MSDHTLMAYGGYSPDIHPSAFLAPGSRVIGNVTMGENVSIWFNTVVRGDVHWIKIGRDTNIQDNSMCHVTDGRSPLSIGSQVTVGHMATLHGCTIEDGCLIGMGAIVLDDALVGSESLVAAGSVVTPRTKIPPRSMVMGSPAKVIRELKPQELEWLGYSWRHYVEVSRNYMKG